ncbi:MULTISPECIES: Lsr2 family protein [unclassified Streptomyces]|uniref:Lsr2 family DNA-binding protein n=1 Tax=unclassified Streptomyces TaxID=2593676 RepID=UPI0014893480|nr:MULTISPECIES: Lsr2 family protein [unclassified Streptomyces]
MTTDYTLTSLAIAAFLGIAAALTILLAGAYVAVCRALDTRTVRAWADANGIDCPRVGQIPKRVLEAWRTANKPE